LKSWDFLSCCACSEPEIKTKVEYINEGREYRDLGQLKEGEDWSGDTKEDYVYFSFGEDSSIWLKKDTYGTVIETFQKWKTFFDENKNVESSIQFFNVIVFTI